MVLPAILRHLAAVPDSQVVCWPCSGLLRCCLCCQAGQIPIRSARFRPIFKIFFWLLFVDCLVLGYIGAMPAEGIYVLIGRLATVWYFAHFLIILPVLSVIETPRPLPQSISQPIFSAAGGGLAGAMSAPKEKVE